MLKWQELDWSKGKDWFYFNNTNGNMLKGWQELDWSGGRNTFYFNTGNGAMVKNGTFIIANRQCLFDTNGCLLLNWINLTIDGMFSFVQS